MSVNIHAHRGNPVPYYEFNNGELMRYIKDAEGSIRRLATIDHPRSVWAIDALKGNIRVMRCIMGGNT